MYGICQSRQGIQLVSEFCHGGALFELLHDSDVDIVYCQQTKMCVDVATGTRYLHEHSPPIVHRDLKSLNLLLKRPIVSSKDTPVVQVADFGLSRMVEAEAEEENDGTMSKGVGTVQWIAPECISSRTYDLMVDIYSCGVCLFEIISRGPPYFEFEERTNICDYVMQGGRPDLEAIPTDFPQSMVDLMEECWAADHKRRPTFGQICARLGEPQGLVQRTVTRRSLREGTLTHAHESFFSRVSGASGASRRSDCETESAGREEGVGGPHSPVTPGSKHPDPSGIADVRRKAFYTRKSVFQIFCDATSVTA